MKNSKKFYLSVRQASRMPIGVLSSAAYLRHQYSDPICLVSEIAFLHSKLNARDILLQAGKYFVYDTLVPPTWTRSFPVGYHGHPELCTRLFDWILAANSITYYAILKILTLKLHSLDSDLNYLLAQCGPDLQCTFISWPDLACSRAGWFYLDTFFSDSTNLLTGHISCEANTDPSKWPAIIGLEPRCQSVAHLVLMLNLCRSLEHHDHVEADLIINYELSMATGHWLVLRASTVRKI